MNTRNICLNRQYQKSINLHYKRLQDIQHRPSFIPPTKRHSHLGSHEQSQQREKVDINNLKMAERIRSAKSRYEKAQFLTKHLQSRKTVKKIWARPKRASQKQICPSLDSKWRLITQQACQTIILNGQIRTIHAQFLNQRLIMTIKDYREIREILQIGEKRALKLLRTYYKGSLKELIKDLDYWQGEYCFKNR